MMFQRMISLSLLLAHAAMVQSQGGAYLGSTSCPSGHSDCQGVGDTPNYCAVYSNTRECWPCIFCEFFQDSIDNCTVCHDSSSDPIQQQTASPTPAPPTVQVSSSTPAQVCHQNCGTQANGGGTCDPTDSSRCTSCNSGKVLLRDLNFNSQNGPFSEDYRTTSNYVSDFRVPENITGKCVTSISCDAKTIQFGPYTGLDCKKCIDRRCHKCSIAQSAGDATPVESCFKCRDGWFLNANSTCAETCDAGKTFSGISLFGRKCLDPFTCESNRVVNGTGGCKCPNTDNSAGDPNCHTCDFYAGEFGQRCRNCRNGKFLNGDLCEDDCSNAAPGMIAYDAGTYGSQCRAPFTCTDGRDENNNKCTCKSIDRSCVSCRFDLPANGGNVCLR